MVKDNESQISENSNVITIRKDALWKYSTFVLAAIVLILVVFMVLPGKSPTGNVIADQGNNLPSKIKASIDDDAVLGDVDAPVTIIEFSDYECPFCQRFYLQTLPSIKTNYIDTGKVKLVFRDYPLSFHPMAQPSAEAAECIRDLGGDEAYFEYHDVLFENQGILSDSNLKAWAQEMGYDIASCLDSGKKTSEVLKDFADGQKYGVSGTPGFLIGNDKDGYVLVSGAQPYSVFQQTIDAAL